MEGGRVYTEGQSGTQCESRLAQVALPGSRGEHARVMTEERRLVTVLFADATGSTVLADSLDPEDVRSILARFFAIARETITAHGGTVEKFIGDAVMAVFGLPEAHGDDAQRGLSAALELRDRVRADPALGMRLPIRIGLNTGEVVATRDRAASDFLVTGDPVNVAARLQQMADPWTVLCGERTARAAREAFEFGSPIEAAIWGKAQLIRAAAVLGRAAPIAHHRTPFVGRDADLAQLELVARRAFTERRPYLVSLIAPAGTGKTRLVEEFLDRLPALAPEATVAVAQCLPYGQRMTFWPLRAVLFQLASISESAPPETVRDALQQWLRERRVDAPARVAEFLAATIGLAEAETTDRDTLFAAWRTAVAAASQQRPLVLVFEDLHWSSDSLLDLFEFLMQPRADVPLLMIALGRPELLDRRSTWGGGRRNYTSLALQPLPDADVAALANHLLGRPLPTIASRVIARAEGNPFFAGEIVRALLEQVPSLTDEATVAHVLDTLPDTVQATVLARLDLLLPPERRLLQLGAVFGRDFQTSGIAALEPELRHNVDQMIDSLLQKDLIRPSESNRFVFRHILIREVAYQTLPRTERSRLHAGAGQWLEEQSTGQEDALAELLAYHYREAATLQRRLGTKSDDGQGVRERAVRWLARAATVAAASTGNIEASRFLRAAIELADTDALPDLYESLGGVSIGNASVEAYKIALRLGQEAGRPVDQQIRILAAMLTVHMRWGGTVETPLAREEMDRLRALGHSFTPKASDESAVARFLIADGFYPFWLGGRVTAEEISYAEQSARRGLEIATHLGDAILNSAALDALQTCAKARYAWEEARKFGRQRLVFEDRLNIQERFDAYGSIAWTSALLGDLDETERITRAAAALAGPVQPRGAPVHLHISAWRTYALQLLGRWDEALTAADRARALWEESGRVPAGYAIHGFLAAMDIARAHQDGQLIERYGETLAAILEQFDPTTPFGRLQPYPRNDIDALHETVVRSFKEIPPPRLHLLERVLALCADHGRPPSVGVIRLIAEFATRHRVRLLEGQARRCLGLAERNPEELARALAVFERAGAAPYVARVRCEWGLLTGDETAVTSGLRVLDTQRDLSQIDRIEHLRRS